MQRLIRIWLNIVFISVLLIMILGSITRLTDSGLSIVNWDLIYGFLPPLSIEDWQIQFDLYKETSQYKLKNHYFELSDFKKIFIPEYLHRLAGKLVGFIFIIPLIFFWMKGVISIKKDGYLFILLILGGLQGLVGIWMVKSGLVERVSVLPLRLAIHFFMAVTIMSIIAWKLSNFERLIVSKQTRLKIILALLLVLLTLFFGVMTASTKAGLISSSFPLFENDLPWPSDYNIIQPFSNLATIQANHRFLAYLTSILTIILLINQVNDKKISQHLLVVVLILATQIVLGILTLISQVSIPLAVTHQVNGVVLFLSYLLLFKRSLIT